MSHEHLDSHKDPRIFENPIEASIELADLTEHRLPGIKRRSRQLLWFGITWTAAIIILSIFTGILIGQVILKSGLSTLMVIALLALPVVLIPSIGLGVALLILAFQESVFLPYLEHASKAMAALGTIPPRDMGKLEKETDKEDREAEKKAGGSIAGIMGSAMWVGDLVPMVERMTAIARAIMAILLIGLAYMVGLVVIGVTTGSYSVWQLVIEIVVFSVFVGPAISLFQWSTRDMEFYEYYSQRHRALAQVAALGIPPVPKGKTYLERFDTFLKALPPVKDMLASDGGVGTDTGRAGYRFSRFYHGKLGEEATGILVKEFDKVPDREDLDLLLDEAKAFAIKKGISISRVVALVAADVDDINDRLYDHLMELGRRTRPGECALQLVMEVEGTYSMVPYVSM